MNINRTGIDIQRTDLTHGVGGAAETQKKQTAAQPAAPAQRGDSVEISSAGRALAAQQTDATSETRAAEMSPERVAELRQRVLAGAYNSVEVVDQVARRMLERGDI